ncbi:MAG: magnesium/cobalt efflux protein [Gammaproteobacteria bacterium RIFCSPHIGHO2_12_FULL_38_11]|nr:MAG: magnesium/cobalt efflux protein [Gammaproteobacteria bacterium RIFCSPHIGHO2_12_FULL_38_11]
MNDHPSWLDRLSHFLSREPHSQKQLIDMLRDAEHRQLIDHDALKMIEGVLSVSDKKVCDIMIPRPQMTVLAGDAHPVDVISTIIQSQHSRFPVTGERPDKILGILLAKDLLPFCINEKHETPIRDLIRPVVYIPESKPLDILLKEFRLNRNHMAIVVDEYGGVSGLVTIEDVLEEIVGDIEDEYDIDEKKLLIKEIEKNIFMVNALTPIDIFNHYFKTDFNNANFDTIGGLIVQAFGYLPNRNETITFGDFEVQVTKATRRGIQSLQFRKTV